MGCVTRKTSMARLLCILGGIIVLAGLTTTPTQAKIVETFSIGPWHAEVYTSDDGKFSLCSGSANYRSGIDLNVLIDRKYNWSLLLWNRNWNFKKTEREVRIKYNGGAWLTVQGSAEGNAIWLYMPTTSTDVELFRASSVLDVSAFGVTQGFNLTGTRRLMQGLVDCVNARLAQEPPSDVAANDQPDTAPAPSPAPATNSGGSGTGFYVSSQGHIVTNEHVISGCQTIKIVRAGEAPEAASLLRVDRVNDLAVLKSSNIPMTSLPQLRTARVRVGEPVAVFGYPLLGTLSASGNITSGNISSLAGLGDDVRHFQISAPIQPGNSGGPLLDMSGNILGVTNAKLNEVKSAQETGTLPQNVNFAIKSSVVANFLDAHSIGYALADETKPTQSLPDVAEKAKTFTVQVLCN